MPSIQEANERQTFQRWLELALEKAEVEETLLQFQRQLITRHGKLLLDDLDNAKD